MIPTCHNRPPFRDTVTVPDGYHADGRRRFAEIPHTMSTDCGSWKGFWTVDPPVRTPDALGFDCEGCRWRPAA
ncbi:MAG: hypothetical protein E6Q97_09380 [Desulfurellales bacterium]|nr:MAG: hypothetical protein E6Q97_09380 [Desulfurellales bacterium]